MNVLTLVFPLSLLLAACASSPTPTESALATTKAAEPPADAWLMSVGQWQAMPGGAGVAVAGRVMRGTLRPQSPGEVLGFGAPIAVTVAAIAQQGPEGRPLTEASAGQDVAVLLSGIEWNALRKGQVLATPGAFQATTTWVADFTLARDEENPERNTPTFAPYPIEIAGVKGQFHLSKAGDPLVYGQAMRGKLELEQPIHLFSGITSTIMWGGAIVGDLTVIEPAPAR